MKGDVAVDISWTKSKRFEFVGTLTSRLFSRLVFHGHLTMGKKSNNQKSAVAPELLNFHFPTSPPSSTPRETIGQQRRTGGRTNRHDQQRYQRSEQDRTSARRKASSQMFYLHSSPCHAFSLTRKSKQGYSFTGPDNAVSWEAVRTVKYLAPATDASTSAESQETCPICLDTFTCARITKCGHCFCLACLMRHIHTSNSCSTSVAVKCPCCALPIHMEDVRPVIIESVQPPHVQTRMKLVKLHRTKDCPAPYLPQRDQWKHAAPHAAPNMSDRDAAFSRFTFVDPAVHQGLLYTNQAELDRYASQLRHGPDHELLFVQMSQERVKNEITLALQEANEEQSLMDQYSHSQAGVYQPIPEYLFAATYQNPAECHQHNMALDDQSAGEIRSDDAQSRFRVESFGSEIDCERPRAESIGSEGNVASKLGRLTRGYSIDSADSGGLIERKQRSERLLPKLPASLYLEEHASQFYQSVDGQLCFLSKFNMNCLTAEFTTNRPDEPFPMETTPNERRRHNPLPDELDGIVLEVESLHLTPEIRKKIPVLAHLPFYTDVLFVELDLNRILSNETKQRFKKESEKRKQRRRNKAIAEKRVDQEHMKKEQQRIDDLKSRMQRIDPFDEFFTYELGSEPVSMTGDQFGPAIGVTDIALSPSLRPRVDPALNFSAVLHTPSYIAMTQEAFPSLGASTSPNVIIASSLPLSQSTPSWGRPVHESNFIPKEETTEELSSSSPGQPAASGKKSKKKEKILLFSTGGQRGGI